MTTVNAGGDADGVAVERVDSPTELAVDSDEELEPKVEKRKCEPRGRRGDDLGTGDVAIPEDTDEELDSPSKRALTSDGRSDDQQLTAGLLRDLLADHRRDMQQLSKVAWAKLRTNS